MSSTTSTSLIEFADHYVEAYNSGDLDRIGELLADDVRLTHHNRGVNVQGKAAAIELFEAYGGLFPDKTFSNRRSIQVVGDRVIIEHTWSGKAAADVPGWADKSEAVSLDLGTFLTVRDGLLVEYHDYG